MKNQTPELLALLESSDIRFTNFPLTIQVPFLDAHPIRKSLQKLENSELKSSILSLQLLHIRGEDVFPVIDVYLNVAESYSPELYLGSLALFGLRKSSDPNAEQGGIGLHEIMDVTNVFMRAKQENNWSYSSFTLSFVSRSPVAENSFFYIERIKLIQLPG